MRILLRMITIHGFLFIFLAVIVLSIIACRNNKVKSDNELVGYWVSGARDTEWGRLIIEYEFYNDFTMKFILRDAEKMEDFLEEMGEYKIIGNKIESTLFETVPFKVKGKNLIWGDNADSVGSDTMILVRRENN